MVDALSDLGRLSPDGHVHSAGVAVEALRRRVVSDFEYLLADDLGDVCPGRGVDLSGYVDLTGGDERLHRHPRPRVFGEQCIENRVADRVTDLVGVSLCHGLTGEEPTTGLAHEIPLELGLRPITATDASHLGVKRHIDFSHSNCASACPVRRR
jgi:hypothetical protein